MTVILSSATHHYTSCYQLLLDKHKMYLSVIIIFKTTVDNIDIGMSVILSMSHNLFNVQVVQFII